MATVKIKFRASSYENKEGSLFYQVIHRRVVRQINSSYKLYPQDQNTSLVSAHRMLVMALRTAISMRSI